VVAIAAVSYLRLRDELTVREDGRRESIARIASTIVELRFDTAVDVGESLATRIQFRKFIKEGKWWEAVKILESVPRDFPYIERIILADTKGILMADVPSVPAVIGMDFSFRDWYQGVSKDWRPYVSNVYQRTAEPRINLVAVAAPVPDPDTGEPIAIMVLQIKLDTFLTWLTGISVGEEGYVYLTDRVGAIVTHPSHRPQDPIVDYSSVPEVRKALAGLSGVEADLNPVEGEAFLSAYRQVPKYGFVVVAAEPVDSAFVFRDRQLRGLLTVYGIILLLNIVLAQLLWYLVSLFYESHRKQRTFLESIGDGVVAIDRSWRVSLWNPAAERLTGWKAHEAIGKPFRSLVKFVREQDRKENIAFIEEAMLFGEAKAMENNTVVITRDGREIPVGDSAAPIYDASGVVSGVVIVFRDITKEKEAHIMRTDFAYASHQLRTPINKALWSLETVLEEAADTRFQGKIKVAHRSMLDVKRLANRLLEVSQIDQQMLSPKTRDVSVAELLRSAYLEIEKLAKERAIAVKLPEIDPKETIDTDPKLFSEALAEVLENAVRFSAEGEEIEVRVKLDRLEMLVDVADRGIGIPEAQQPLIFTKFFRGQNVPAEAVGAGLGLFVAREYVRLLGGKLWFESRLGEGSTFSLKVPRIQGMKL
jgi:PAS domain S-box-containing protein